MFQYSIPLPNTYVKSRLSTLDDPLAETHTIRYYIVHEEFFKNYEADIGLIRIHAPPLLSDIVSKPPLLLAEEKYKVRLMGLFGNSLYSIIRKYMF